MVDKILRSEESHLQIVSSRAPGDNMVGILIRAIDWNCVADVGPFSTISVYIYSFSSSCPVTNSNRLLWSLCPWGLLYRTDHVSTFKT